MSQPNKKNTNQDPFYVIHGYRFLSNTEKTDKKRKKIQKDRHEEWYTRYIKRGRQYIKINRQDTEREIDRIHKEIHKYLKIDKIHKEWEK